MKRKKHYTKDFYQKRQSGVKSSADIVVPIVIELVKPRSVVDVGCGTGEFIEVFRNHGVTDVLGIDREYVEKGLIIPIENFMTLDLENSINLTRKFDLVVCLEVAEHLSPGRARGFIVDLVKLAPIVLFSAAIPGQGGTNHINEQWITYWTKLFEDHGYLPVDAIRKKVWRDKRVKPWYRQNTIIFCERNVLKKNKVLAAEYNQTSKDMLSVVLPEIFDYYVNRNGNKG